MQIAAFDMGIKNFAFAIMVLDADNHHHVKMLDHHAFCPSHSLHRELIEYLHGFDDYWRETDVLLIEQQMNRLNIHATRMACHVMAFFYHCFPEKKILEYPSSYKTRFMEGGLHLNYKERKSFAIQKVFSLYEHDPVLLDWITSLPKSDDVADCILMCYTFPSCPLSRG